MLHCNLAKRSGIKNSFEFLCPLQYPHPPRAPKRHPSDNKAGVPLNTGKALSGGVSRNPRKFEVFVQFWLRPGEQAVVFDPGNEPPADPIPAELKAFL